jgi:hypothetical protein
MSASTSGVATLESFQRFLRAEPLLGSCAPLASVIAIAERTLLHAGPPFQHATVIPKPVLNGAITAALFEGWCKEETDAREMILRGDIQLSPAQDYRVVTPLAFVVSPSMSVLGVSDVQGNGSIHYYTPINDGPAPGARRFGARDDKQDERLKLQGRIGPALHQALRVPIPILPLMRAGLASGDDLHGRVTATNAALADILAPRLLGEARDYLSVASQFALNVIMAACALMIGAGTGITESRAVTVAGGNGVSFGWKLAGAPSIWHTVPAERPVGPRFTNAGNRHFLPAIGDSAVIDACGFGAAALRYAPEMMAALRGHVPSAYFESAASTPFIGAHPAFPSDLALCLDIDRTGPVRGVMLGAIDADGEAGLIGRGIAPW